MAQITKELALSIAKKLKATIEPGSKHDFALIYYEGKLIAQFGIRRGANKEIGHDFIPSQIYLNTNKTKLLGQCPFTYEDWLLIMHEKGKI